MGAAVLVWIWRLVLNLAKDFATLIGDLASSEHRAQDSDSEEPARQDDLLDAMGDDDEIDAAGL